MPDLNNIQEVVEQAPQLFYRTSTNSINHIAGSRCVVKTEATARVDYIRKTAKIVTVTNQDNNQIGAACYYEDRKLIVKAIDLADNSEEDSDSVKEFSDDEWEKLFAADGALRPIVFAHLEANNNHLCVPNTLVFCGKDIPSPTDEKVESNLIIKVASEDTLLLNSLVSYSDAVTKNLVVIDTDLTIHVVD